MKRTMKSTSAVALVATAALALAACGGDVIADTNCIEPDTAAERVRFASIVVLGTVTAWDGTAAELEIVEIWRGPDLSAKVEIVPEPGRAFTTGVEYLVFPKGTVAALADEPCSATIRWVPELAQLRPETARVPGSVPADDADLPWEWVLAGAALVVALGAGRRIRDGRRHPEPVWDPDHSLKGDG